MAAKHSTRVTYPLPQLVRGQYTQAQFFDQTAVETMKGVIRDLRSGSHRVQVRRAAEHDLALVTRSDKPVAVAYFDGGVSLDEAAAALTTLAEEFWTP